MTLYESQQRHTDDKPADTVQDAEAPPLYKLSTGQVWVSKKDRVMQRALYALTHQGISGHRGRDVTLARLEIVVCWDGMDKDVTHWRQYCLQCLKLAEGNMVPRPLGTQLVAERPGEILMMDYIKMGTATDTS